MRNALRRRLFAVLACSFLAVCPGASADPATVRSVDFYPSGAKFVFQVKSGGSFDFVLPGAFSLESLRCLTKERLTSLETEVSYEKEKDHPELLALERKMDAASREVSLFAGRRAALNQTLEMLQSPFARTQDDEKGGISAKELIEYAASAQKLRLDIETELVDIGIGEAKAKKVHAEAREEYEAMRVRLETKKPHNPRAILKVGGTTSAPATLLFEAYTPAAGWRAGYEMEMNSATGEIDAKMNAVAWQGSGVDVNGLISFHTRQPSFAVTPPEVNPLTVGLRIAEKNFLTTAYNAVKPQQDSFEPRIGALGDALEERVPAPAPPETISTLTSVSVNGRGKIGGDRSEARISLGEFSMKSAPVIVSIPEQNREAWIIASMDAVPQSLLPGVAELAVDGAATGRTAVSESMAGMTRMPFGMVSRITSKKTPLVSRTGSNWTGKGLLDDGYTLEITSAMENEREVTVRDRIPIPTTDKIVLEVKKIDPAPDERDNENRLLWRIKLKPGETKKITVEYTLRFPGDETLEYR
ncbi:MAG: DUF4139 domain-containing protein [Synergistaceae bacterium]|jgi:uncharacterized protein (TIGR02231 family)|nr:DUF4139 domain-containing protein [Synergistaceae bacterium]